MKIDTTNFTLEDFNKAIEDKPMSGMDAGSIKKYIDLREKELIKKLAKVFKESES